MGAVSRKDRAASAPALPQQRLGSLLCRGVQVAGRLVQHHHPGRRQPHASQRDELPLPRGQSVTARLDLPLQTTQPFHGALETKLDDGLISPGQQ